MRDAIRNQLPAPIFKTEVIMEKVCGIYKITCESNGHYYYGSAVDLDLRWRSHKRELKNGMHFNPRVQYTWDKYGESSFKIELIETVTKDTLLEVEDTYLKEHVGKPHCMNISHASRAPSLFGKDNPASRLDVQTRISESLKSYYKINSVSTEIRSKISNAAKGRVVTVENRKKLSDVLKLYWKTHPDTRKKRKVQSAETRLKISITSKGRNLVPRDTRVCQNPNCDVSFIVERYKTKKHCSHRCAAIHQRARQKLIA